jgi:hypothetical protein
MWRQQRYCHYWAIDFHNFLQRLNSDSNNSMHDFILKRFDSRILEREDDGSAFERFVDEFLRLEAPGEELVRGLARGPDGAIDIADARKNIQRIVECKFIGADTKSTAKERWNEVKRHLEDNLVSLASGDELRRKKYRPWLQSEGDLNTYTFVTSSICPSADERNQLRKSISDFFEECSKAHAELSHLKDVVVDLRYWDDLAGKSADFAPLFYRWFGGFPQGYGEVTLSFGSKGGFKQFLANRNLPYFSRDLYLSEIGQSPVDQFDTILELLTRGNDARAHVISGPGGIGKTRLSIEVCERAREAGWWPIRLDRKARVSKLDAICQSHVGSAKLLLLIDYAEAFEELDQLSEAVARLASDGRHRISVLASTRSSSLQKVTDQLADLHFSVTDLSQHINQDGYADWVVRKIADHFGIPQPDEIARICKGLPIMAAFAGFLYQKDRVQFDLQFGNLAAVKDFSDWASVRQKALEDRFASRQIKNLLADFVVRLPITKTEANAFRDGSDIQRDVFDILKADRWIETEAEFYSAAHDVIADAVLARYLSEMPGLEEERVRDIAFAALKEDRLDRFIAALDRLGDHPVSAKLSGKVLVEALMGYDHKKTLTAFPKLINSRLLHPRELIALLATSHMLRTRLAEAPEAHITVARAGEWAVTKGRAVIDREVAEQALTEPLCVAVAFQHPSNMILRCAHAFDPLRFHNDVIKRLIDAPMAPQSHYLIVSLLKWGTQTDEVLVHLKPWLVDNSTELKASFVYKAWLNVKGGIEAIRENLLFWVAEHGKKHDAQFVYSAWLDAKGEVDAIRDNLIFWMAEHGKKPEASYVYQSWLNAEGAIDIIRENLIFWMAEHGTKHEARFVYTAWLDAKGEVHAIRDHLLFWVAQHGIELDARFVYKSWLDAGGEIDAISEKLLLWVNEYSTTWEAQFVYTAWLDAKGEVGAIRDNLLFWVSQHGAKQRSQFVYKSWLDAGGDIDLVREKLLLWVSEYGTTLEAQFVYRAWLVAKGEVEAIKTACEAWLQEHWNSEDAVYVTKELSKIVDLSSDSVACILAWAGAHSTNEDAIYRLSRVSRSFYNHVHSPDFSLLVTKVTAEVMAHLFSKQKHPRGVRDACSILFANFAKLSYPRDSNWPKIIDVYCKGLKHGSVFWHISQMPKTTWEILLREALRLEMLDPIADTATIRQGHELIQQARLPEEYTSLMSSGFLEPPYSFTYG